MNTNESDAELLRHAARAAGLELVTPTMLIHRKWNPLTDDGDAFRLMVKLRMEVSLMGDAAWAMATESEGGGGCSVLSEDQPDCAARRAITRAAAETGRRMTSE